MMFSQTEVSTNRASTIYETRILFTKRLYEAPFPCNQPVTEFQSKFSKMVEVELSLEEFIGGILMLDER
jgi:hypothetical protein